MAIRVVALCASFVFAACESRSGGSAVSDPADDPRVTRARGAVGAFKAELKQALVAALADGPAKAVEICATEAPRLAAAASTGGLTIGRATARPRNPANAATDWRAEAIASFEAMAPAARDAAVFTRRLATGALAYAEPLVVQDLCVVCHGASLAPDVAQTIAARYPSDRATGYATGDLRGVAWAVVE